jgi:hypothetical protein
MQGSVYFLSRLTSFPAFPHFAFPAYSLLLTFIIPFPAFTYPSKDPRTKNLLDILMKKYYKMTELAMVNLTM